jgi:hypothetical protein
MFICASCPRKPEYIYPLLLLCFVVLFGNKLARVIIMLVATTFQRLASFSSRCYDSLCFILPSRTCPQLLVLNLSYCLHVEVIVYTKLLKKLRGCQEHHGQQHVSIHSLAAGKKFMVVSCGSSFPPAVRSPPSPILLYML